MILRYIIFRKYIIIYCDCNLWLIDILFFVRVLKSDDYIENENNSGKGKC